MCLKSDLTHFFDDEKVPQEYAIIVANQTISTNHFNHLYRRARIKVCADGGYDKLKDWASQSCLDTDDYIPDYVVGDIDSLEEDHNNKRRPKVIKIVDQDKNDLQKCIDFVRDITSGQPHIAIIVIGALGGRFDHELQSLSILYEYCENPIIYLNEKSLVTLLGHGKTDINVDSIVIGPHCGFGPLISSSIVTTYGFKWDLKHQGTK